MTITVRNLACPCCIVVVTQLCNAMALPVKQISYGKIEFVHELSEELKERFASSLQPLGLEIVSDPKKELVEQVKALMQAKVHEAKIEPQFVLSTYLKSNTLKDYSTLTKMFSATEGITIEQFFVRLKMEKAKQLLSDGSYSIKQVAVALGYSNSQHFSTQFRKTAGKSPSGYRLHSVLVPPQQLSILPNILSIVAN